MDTKEFDETHAKENQDQPPPPTDNPTDKGQVMGRRKRGKPSSSTKPPLPTKKAKGSSIWEHFTKEDPPPSPPPSTTNPLEEPPPPKCMCKYCGTSFFL